MHLAVWKNKGYIQKEKTKNAKEYNDTYQYLEQALIVAGRKHSYLETNDNKKNNTNN
ncbi:hypothetical protein LLP67_10765 [Staphylococcus hominis]|nr:hypothetical protein [Staphylococcus hominis]